MVFKRVLKGIGRLMLTTAVMCGVGLFLCSSEVKADSLSFNYNGDKIEIVLTVNTPGNIDLSSATFEVYKDSSGGAKLIDSATLKVINGFRNDLSITTSSNNESVSLASIDKAIFLEKINKNELLSGENKIVLKCSKSGIDTDIPLKNSSSEETTVFKIVPPTINETTYDTDVNNPTEPTYTITATCVKDDIGYGYKGEKYTITSSALGDKYYVNYGDGSAEWDDADADAAAFKPANTAFEGTLGDAPAIPTKAQYFPTFTKIGLNTSPSAIYLDGSGINTTTISKSNIALYYDGTNPLSNKDKDVILSNMIILPDLQGSDNISNWSGTYNSGSGITINLGAASTPALTSNDKQTTASLKFWALKKGVSSRNDYESYRPPINDVSSDITKIPVYAKPTGIAILKNGSVVKEDTINVSTTATEYTLKVLPGAADQRIDYSKTVDISGNSHSTVEKDTTNKVIKITGNTAGTDTIKINAYAYTGVSTSELTANPAELKLSVVAFNKDKTVSKINESNENYITVGDYKLDIASLVSKYATDGTNKISGITVKKVEITSGSDYAEVVDSTKIKGKKEGTVKLDVYLSNSSTAELSGVRIDVYPKPTATYSSSNRTLTVKMPTKVSTGYGEEKNIRKTTGFKLLLEDSSGNTLYEYTDSKYQKVLSSSSDKTVSYTVTASDIEGMVTSAASNGKFSSDTTSVKFKVIPMGYKQSNSEDETIKAKDEIAGTTDAVTVYKISASGTNFTSTAAYGLDGQTVSLTATPNSGYTFKQWSDGNTSNPRQIKVSASGTRSFQAVAGERVANSTGAGGTDNSELYDDVPKTSESNSAIWLIVFMVFAVMGTTYALYLQLRAANSKHDR